PLICSLPDPNNHKSTVLPASSPMLVVSFASHSPPRRLAVSFTSNRPNLSSQIRQPPIAATRLHPGKPFAQRIKQQHSDYPANVNEPKTEANAGWSRLGKSIKRTFKLKGDLLTGQKTRNHCDQMCRVPLQKIKEQWHPA